MSCYRKGGCGPYEMYSCSECPASKPEYSEKYYSSISTPPSALQTETEKQKIQNQVQYHYDSLIKKGYEVVGVFLYGSQNYLLHYEDSDIDTKAIILPKFNDFILSHEPFSITITLDNGDLCDVKDIRKMFECYKKQNINFIETLFTKYMVINPEYEDLFAPMLENNEAIARLNNYAAVNCITGMAFEKYAALKRPYPSIKDKIDLYHYDPKQAHHIMRLEEFLDRYISGEKYSDCLITKQKDFLLDIKRGKYDVKWAEQNCAAAIERIKLTKEKYMNKNELKVNNEAVKLMQNVLINILKFNFKNELTI